MVMAMRVVRAADHLHGRNVMASVSARQRTEGAAMVTGVTRR